MRHFSTINKKYSQLIILMLIPILLCVLIIPEVVVVIIVEVVRVSIGLCRVGIRWAILGLVTGVVAGWRFSRTARIALTAWRASWVRTAIIFVPACWCMWRGAVWSGWILWRAFATGTECRQCKCQDNNDNQPKGTPGTSGIALRCLASTWAFFHTVFKDLICLIGK